MINTPFTKQNPIKNRVSNTIFVFYSVLGIFFDISENLLLSSYLSRVDDSILLPSKIIHNSPPIQFANDNPEIYAIKIISGPIQKHLTSEIKQRSITFSQILFLKE